MGSVARHGSEYLHSPNLASSHPKCFILPHCVTGELPPVPFGYVPWRASAKYD